MKGGLKDDEEEEDREFFNTNITPTKRYRYVLVIISLRPEKGQFPLPSVFY